MGGVGWGGGTRDMKCDFGCLQPLAEGFNSIIQHVDRSSCKAPVYIYSNRRHAQHNLLFSAFRLSHRQTYR
jgi:hypothetical protein